MPADPHIPDSRVLELVHRVADDSADDSERRELEALVAADPGILTEVNALRVVIEALDSLPLEDPPAEMRATILEELRRRKSAAPRPVGAAPVQPRRAPLAPSSRFSPGRFLAMAAGLLLLAGSAYVYERSTNPGAPDPEPSASSATMVSRDPRMWRIEETIPAKSQSGSPGMILRRNGDRFAVEITRSKTGPGQGAGEESISLNWDPQGLECVSIVPAAARLEEANRIGSVPIAGDGSARSGTAPTLAVFRKRPGYYKPQEVLLRVAGAEYLRATISTN